MMLPFLGMKGEFWVNRDDISAIERHAVNGVTVILKNGHTIKAFGQAHEIREILKGEGQ